MSIHPRELPFIRQMFDNIAPHYDLLNRLLSLRRDVAWRREMAAAVAASCRGRILDVACGTGDVIIALCSNDGISDSRKSTNSTF